MATAAPAPVELLANTKSTELQHLITGLGPQLIYEFSVQAINSVGTGLKSPVGEPVLMPATAPSQVAGPLIAYGHTMQPSAYGH